MAVSTLDALAGSTKDTFMLEGIEDTLRGANVGLAQLKRSQRRGFQFGTKGEASLKVKSGGNAQYVGAGATTLPTPKAMSTKKVDVKPSYVYGAVSFTDKLVQQATRSSSAFADLAATVKADAMETVQKSLSIAFYLDKIGEIAKFASTTEGGGSAGAFVYEVDNINSFYEGMVIDFVTSAGADITNGTGIQVIGVDKRNRQITVDAAVEPTIPDTAAFIVFENSYNNTLRGLRYLLNDKDYSDTFFGLSRTTYPTLAVDTSLGGPNYASLKDFTIQDLWELLDMPEEIGPSKPGEGRGIDLVLTTKELKRKIATLLFPSRRFNSIDLEGGYRASELDNDGRKAGLMSDARCPRAFIYALTSKSFELFMQDELKWMEVVQGGGIFRLGASTSIYEGYPSWMAQYYCKNPRMNAVMRYVQ